MNKTIFKWLLIISLVFTLGASTSSIIATGSYDNVNKSELRSYEDLSTKEKKIYDFEADEKLNEDMTFNEALQKYPEIKDIYCMEDVEEEDIPKLDEDYVQDETYSADIIMGLSAMRPEAVEIKAIKYRETLKTDPIVQEDINILNDIQLQSSSAYGCAWKYRQINSKKTNCYVYALGKTGWWNPGDFAYYNNPKYPYGTTLRYQNNDVNLFYI